MDFYKDNEFNENGPIQTNFDKYDYKYALLLSFFLNKTAFFDNLAWYQYGHLKMKMNGL